MRNRSDDVAVGMVKGCFLIIALPFIALAGLAALGSLIEQPAVLLVAAVAVAAAYVFTKALGRVRARKEER